jgi:GntR family transcriptional regulator
MFIVLSPHNPDPMYKQVTDQIKDAVASGDLKPDDRLPSIREISKELNVSQITIKRAYADLENEGFIYTRAGMGSFVADVNQQDLKQEKLEEIRKGLTKLIKSGEKFDISIEDIINLLKQEGGES